MTCIQSIVTDQFYAFYLEQVGRDGVKYGHRTVRHFAIHLLSRSRSCDFVRSTRPWPVGRVCARRTELLILNRFILVPTGLRLDMGSGIGDRCRAQP